MTWLDYTIVGVTVLSLAWGLWRGLVREVMSVAGWIIAFLTANLLAGPLGEALPPTLAPEVRVLLAFVGIFIACLAVTTLAGLLLARIIRAVGLGGLDHTLGAMFGVARAAIIALAFGLVAGLTRLPHDPLWTESVSGPLLARAALATKPWLPPALAERLRYHSHLTTPGSHAASDVRNPRNSSPLTRQPAAL
jgi:membrane protein required for colicin V production